MQNLEIAAIPSSPILTVLIADDHVLVRDGIKLLVTKILGTTEFVEAGDGESLLKAVRNQPQIQLALVDLNMPGMDNGFCLSELARTHPLVPIVVISGLTSPDVVRRTMAISTVYAFVPKSATSDHIRASIDAALGKVKLPYASAHTAMPGPDTALTPRLEEVRSLLRQGMSNKLIASTLGISEGTVKNHMSEIFKTLKVTNRTQAAQFNPGAL
jgi:DNA-binding NarL/FixJ family response regulator